MALTKVHNRMSKGAPLSPYDFGAVGDGVADDTAAMVAWVAYLNDDVENFGVILPGVYNFSQTLSLTTRERAIIGVGPDAERTGTPRSGSATLRWTGANTDSMFSTDTARHKFAYLNIEGETQAKDFIEMTAGSQALRLENITFGPNIDASTLLFDRAVIYSDGSRMGYSHFKDINMGKIAPYFIKAVADGTGGMTPINFEYCEFKNGIFSGGASGGTDPYTIYYSDGATLEGLRFWRCTFISAFGVTIADTRTNPTSSPIRSLIIEECEIDNVSDDGVGFRLGYLTNVENVKFSNNIVTGESPGITHLFDCNNTNIVSCYGNRMNSLDYLFDLDSSSLIRGLGFNGTDWSSVEGITDATDNWYVSVTQANNAFLDGSVFGPADIGHYICDVTSNTAYGFRLDLSRPQNWEPGQVFILTIRNTSGGTVPDPGISINMVVKAGGITAPANGNQISIWFRFDGTKARQILPEGPELANT